MLKTTGIIIGAMTFGLIAGYSQSKEVASTNRSSAPPSRDEAGAVSATSRDTNTSSRIYAPDSTNATSKAADNTGRNVRDRSDATLTPGDQGNSDSDLEITREIRRAVSSNEQLSTTAKNIKIITANGKVTLRGPVKTPEEQQKILSIATSIARGSSVDNQLEVKALNQ